MPDVKALQLVNQKYANAEKKREKWEMTFGKLTEKLSKAKTSKDQKKAFEALEKHASTRRKADDELVKASEERDKRIKELSKEFG